MSAPSIWSRKPPTRLLLALLLLAATPLGAALPHDLVLCQIPADKAPSEAAAGGLLPADYGEGSRILRLSPDASTVNLTPAFASACDPDISFDGERMLFAAQKEPGDPWNIWESSVDGSDARQITHGELDARQPIYLSTFYTITSSEPWYIVLFRRSDGTWNETASAASTSLYTVRLDGDELRRITFNPGNEGSPHLMTDGLLIFSSWKGRGSEAWPEGRSALYGVQPDGIDYHLYGGLQGARLQHMPTEQGDKVFFVENDLWPWDGAGRLATLDRRRPLYAYRTLELGQDHLWHSPSALPDGGLLVSRRPADGSGTLDLFVLDPESGKSEPVMASLDAHEMHARYLGPRPEPDGRSSTVRTEFDTGKLYGLDIYDSQDALLGVERGAVQKLRVHYANRSAPSEDGELGELEMSVLGETTVEEDGSFHFDLPADLPVKIEALSQQGEILASCDWIWVRQREFRGCIGCHEDGERTPENRMVKATVREAEKLGIGPDGKAEISWLVPAHGSTGSTAQESPEPTNGEAP